MEKYNRKTRRETKKIQKDFSKILINKMEKMIETERQKNSQTIKDMRIIYPQFLTFLIETGRRIIFNGPSLLSKISGIPKERSKRVWVKLQSYNLIPTNPWKIVLSNGFKNFLFYVGILDHEEISYNDSKKYREWLLERDTLIGLLKQLYYFRKINFKNIDYSKDIEEFKEKLNLLYREVLI